MPDRPARFMVPLRKWLWGMIAPWAMIVAATGAGLPASPIKIGLLAPPDEAEAQSLRRGVEAAVASVRGRGVPVELVIRGRTGQWGVDGDEAAQLALDDGADGLISPPSGASTHLVLQVAGRTATPVVSLCPDSSVTGAGIPWMLQVVPETRAEARALFAHLGAVGKEPLQSWAAVVPAGRAGRAGREIAADLRWAATNAGVSLLQVLEMPAPGNARDASLARAGASFTNELSDALATRPAGLLVWLDPGSAGLLTKQIREAGYRGHLVGPGRLLSPIFRKAAGVQAMTVHVAVPELGTIQGQLGANGPNRLDPLGDQGPDWTAAMAHDAALVLVERLRRGETGSRSPAPAVDGLTGRLQFTREGRRDGKLKVVLAGLVDWP